jgi:ATP-dependent RNA helicase DeaD
MDNFKKLGIREDLLKGIEALGFQDPTPIQALVIPTLLSEDVRDVMALAQTGTGKTAAFGLPMLPSIDINSTETQGLILCPTRELCIQVAKDIENYAIKAGHLNVVPVYGGSDIVAQMRLLKRNAHIVVATPGRLIDLMKRKAIKLENIQRVVLDEADEMLNMGFKDDIDMVMETVVNRKSVWLFSATMSKEVRRIATNYMTNIKEVGVGSTNQTNENIKHVFYVCNPNDRYATLKRIVDFNPGIYGLIFCRTKNETREIAEQMMQDGYNSDALHGDMSQNDRERVMNLFKSNSLQLLIATDVAARGIDVSNISHVINYGLPDDLEVYTHRSGRTGRAGKKGISISITTPRMTSKIQELERFTKATFTREDIPNGDKVCEQQLFYIIKNIHEIEVHEEEIAPYLDGIYEELKDLSKEELIKKLTSVEFNRFLNYYRDAEDLNPRKREKGTMQTYAGAGGARDTGYVRLFINIGEMDGMDKQNFFKLLVNTVGIPTNGLGRVDSSKSYTHFDIEAKYKDKAISSLLAMDINGRKIRIDTASERRNDGGGERSFRGGGGGFDRGPRRDGGGGGGFRGGNRDSGGSSGGGYKGNRDSSSSRDSGSRTGFGAKKPFSGGTSKPTFKKKY